MEKELEKTTALPQVYEVGFHIVPTVAENDLGVEVTRVRDSIEAAGGRTFADEYPRHIDLSYPMVKVVENKRTIYHSSYFGWMKFDAEPSGIRALDSALKQNNSILRFVLIKTVREHTMVPKKVLREKHVDEIPRAKVSAEEKPAMTEEELDKTIEDLVIS
ncbi:MAG: 30S ribosomal protein S6 [Patescibacteria group bacterium]